MWGWIHGCRDEMLESLQQHLRCPDIIRQFVHICQPYKSSAACMRLDQSTLLELCEEGCIGADQQRILLLTANVSDGCHRFPQQRGYIRYEHPPCPSWKCNADEMRLERCESPAFVTLDGPYLDCFIGLLHCRVIMGKSSESVWKMTAVLFSCCNTASSSRTWR